MIKTAFIGVGYRVSPHEAWEPDEAYVDRYEHPDLMNEISYPATFCEFIPIFTD